MVPTLWQAMKITTTGIVVLGLVFLALAYSAVVGVPQDDEVTIS